jgi:hypothetical protein
MQAKWVGLIWSCLVVAAAAEASDAAKIRVWTRAPGSYWDGAMVDGLAPSTLTVPEKGQVTIKTLDVQYDATYEYRGIALADLLSSYQPAPGAGEADTILLHFSNRMIVPVARELWQNPHPDYRLFLALAIRQDKGKWSQDFPEVSRPDERYRDPTPLTFVGNKMVVGKLWRTGRFFAQHQSFSPWKFAGSLVGVEFVNGNAYEAQFARADGKSSSAGQRVFLDRCQYCHGVRHVGAKYGWDLVDPLPIYKKRDVASLFLHVRYDKPDAIQQGLFMPHQKDFTKAEAEPLWEWLRQVTRGKMAAYRP